MMDQMMFISIIVYPLIIEISHDFKKKKYKLKLKVLQSWYVED